MSYEKNTWADGDIITAEKLNYLEDGVEDASGYDYSVNEVEKVNESFSTSSTSDTVNFQVFINGEYITVILDGNEYTLQATDAAGGSGTAFVYGDQNYVEYPIFIYTYKNGGTESASIGVGTTGDHILVIKQKETTITTTDGFDLAVENACEKHQYDKPRFFYLNLDLYRNKQEIIDDVAYTMQHSLIPLIGYYVNNIYWMTGKRGNGKTFIEYTFQRTEIKDNKLSVATIVVDSEGNINENWKDYQLTVATS